MGSARFFEQLTHFWLRVPQQKLSAICTLLLITYCAQFFSTVIWQVVPVESDHGAVTPIMPQTNVSKSNQQQSNDINPLLKLHIFGQYNQPTKAKPKPVVTNKPAPKTRLNVNLVGLVADASSDVSPTSVAIIESSKGQGTYGIGDQIDGTQAKVHQIVVDRVILSVSGRFETLMLEGIEYSTTIPGSANDMNDSISKKEASMKINTVAPEIKAKEESKKKVDRRNNVELSEALRKEREEMFKDPKKLMDHIRIRPYRQSGKLIGFRLRPGKDPALFKEVGLKHNDLAVEINGYDLTDMQQAFTVMKELKSMTEANITVLRDETPVVILLAL